MAGGNPFAPARIDFYGMLSGLGQNLAQGYERARQQSVYDELGAVLASGGTPRPEQLTQAASRAFRAGQPDLAMSVLKMGESARERENEEKAVSAITGGLGSRPPAAPTTQAAPQPDRSTPTFAGGDRNAFVQMVMPHAIGASKATGVDPRIIVAQTGLETGWGRSAPGNNLFGIKSHGAPGGQNLATTEVVNGQPVRTTASFRTFESPQASVAGYADFINTNPRYAQFRTAQGLDAQAEALGRSGYATDPNYGTKVRQIAESIPYPSLAGPATGTALPAQTASAAQTSKASALDGLTTPQLVALSMRKLPANVHSTVQLLLKRKLEQETGDTLLSPEEKASLPGLRDYPGPVVRKGSGGYQLLGEQFFGPQAAARIAAGAQNREEETIATGRGKRAVEIEESAARAPEQLSKLNLLGTLLDKATTGRLGPAEATVGAWLQAFNIDPGKVGLNPNQPIAAEAVEKIVNELTVGMIGQGGFPANNFSDADRAFLRNIFPTISGRPEANRIALEARKRALQLTMDVADAWGEYQARAEGSGHRASFGGFERFYRAKVRDRDSFGDLREQIANLPQSGRATPQSTSLPPPDQLKIGTVVRGYRYKGGDRFQASSWVKVKP